MPSVLSSTLFQKSPARLSVEAGPCKATTFDIFQTKTFIGRKEGSFILADTKISACHLLIEYVDGNFMLVDLKSRAGTWVNGKKRIKALLKDQDTFKIGDSLIRISIFKDQPPAKIPQPLQNTNTKKTVLSKSLEKKEELNNHKPDLGREIDKEINLFKAAASLNRIPKDQKRNKGSLSILRKSKVTVQVLEGPDKGKIFPFKKGSMLVGRMGADIDLTDTDVSRKHCLFEVFSPDKIYVRDLSSTNGTTVNNRAIHSCKIKTGDLIEIGDTVLELLVEVASGT
jgi:pSer/pThr/pTyr-binding forkhead associated (FHA) protein